jgi:subtilisin-like proprotein convertase family protein
LQDRFPEIRTYTGVGITDPSAMMKCDLTPKGFHAMILSRTQNTVFIDPYTWEDKEHYVSYYKKDYTRKEAPTFTCQTETALFDEADVPTGTSPDYAGDCGNLRKYRLALSCTGEYAQFHGGTKPLVLAAMVQSMNRVNGVYEREVGVTMTIIANNDLIIYLTASSDPFSNGSGSTMLGENLTTCNNIIGTANYDIGHVFSTGGGGVAELGCVCKSSKARGVTGSSQPIGDAFDIDYVAHEMGHQFGGSHTFNNSCGGNISTAHAMEPGSGTTIMGYAGICPPDIQAHSDDYFHAITLQQIGILTSTGTANSCAQKIANNNNSPVVNAGADRTIPKSTPFALTAVGSDPDNDPITYCWEQMDPESGTQPPAATNAAGPMFRSFLPVAAPIRYFPRLVDVINNATPQWEKLPSVARNMKFRVVIRDNHTGGSCTKEDDMVVTVSGAAGPFLVTAPNTLVTWYVGETKSVTWSVNNTNLAPVNCANVKISLSTDGGFTYPVVLAASVPNTGTADVSVPNNVSTTCRVKVEAVGNVFYDISNQNFKIEAPLTPTFVLNASTASLAVCAGNNATFTLNSQALAGFTNAVQFSMTGLPAGATASFSANPAPPTGTVTVTVSNLTPAAAGTYTLTTTGTSGSIVQNTNVSLSLLPGAPIATAVASNPLDGATGASLLPTLTWMPVQYAESYLVEASTSPTFSPVIFTSTVTTPSATFTTSLNTASVVYWRVKASNSCGQGVFSSANAFQTGAQTCNQVFTSTDVPKVIDAATAGSITSTNNVTVSKSIIDVNATLAISHTYMGDVSAILISPANDTVELFNQPGFPATQFGCSGDNVALTLDDEATQTAATLEATCGNLPAISGTFKAIGTMSDFDGENSLGNWKLVVSDAFAEDGGNITAWSLNFCFSDPIGNGSVLINQTMTVPYNSTTNIPNTKLKAQNSGTTAQVTFTLISLPFNGVLLLNGVQMALGATFTQGNIDAGQLAYRHSANNATLDNFKFDVLDVNNSGWVHNNTFNINIVQNSIAANAAQVQGISCFNGNNGSLNVTASGGTAPLSYSLNGGLAQGSNFFQNLSAGSYTIVVADANGFTLTTNTVVLANPSAVSASANVFGSDVSVNATGGSGAYTYSLDGQNFNGSNYFSNLANGVYTITVKDANGCTTTTNAVVAVNTLLAGLQLTTPISCSGGSNAVITVTAAGGQLPFQYSLNGGAFQGSNVFSNLTAGSYTVTVKDNFSLSITTSALVINNPTALTAFASPNLNVITVSASGGTGALQYSLDGTNFQQGNVFQNMANGNYTITVKDANGCTTTTVVNVFVTPLSGSASNTSITCFGGNTSITASANGGITPYQYSLDNGSYQNSGVFSGVLAGNHTINIKDAAGAIFPVSTTVNQPSQLTATTAVSANDFTVTATGGTSPYQYTFTSTNSTGQFNNVQNGTFAITVTDANFCGTVQFVTINYTALGATNQAGSPTCNGLSDGRILVSANNGTAPYQYSLDGTNFQTGSLFTGLAAGTYNVTVRDAVGDFFSINNITINQPSAIMASASATGGNVTVTASGGTGVLLYQIDGSAYQTNPNFAGITAGTHTINVKDQNGCIATTTVVVAVIVVPLSSEVGAVSGVLCAGNSNGSASICVNNGVTPYTVTYTPNVGNISPNSGNCTANYAFGGLSAGNYNVVITDAAGTTQTLSFVIATPAPIAATATAIGSLVSVTATGGTGTFQYSLDNSGIFQDNASFPNVSVGTHTITIRDQNGCTTTASVTVENVVLPLTASAVSVSSASCAGSADGEAMICVNGGVSPYALPSNYTVNTVVGNCNGNFQIIGLAAGNYQITLTDAGANSFVVSFDITAPSAIALTVSQDFDDIIATASGGTAPLKYSIDGVNFQNSTIFPDLLVGNYTITVQDANGCTTSMEYILEYVGTVDVITQWGLSIAPNPSTGVFALNIISTTLNNQGLQGAIFNTKGQLLRRLEIAQGTSTTRIDLSDLPDGIYMLQLTDGAQVGSVRLTKI